MKKYILYIVGIVLFLFSIGWYFLFFEWENSDQGATVIANSDVHSFIYHKIPSLSVLGQYHQEKGFNRLEQQSQGKVRPKVWQLSQHSAGLSIRFQSDSPYIAANWSLERERHMRNMTDIATSGLDLYIRKDSSWKYVASAIPNDLHNHQILTHNLSNSPQEYLLYLPLYNDITDLEIGVLPESNLSFEKKEEDVLPIVIYGTSITQGASASRPGLAYPSILSRTLGKEIINLGFSGNGRMEMELAEVICGIPNQLIIIDCTPNMSPVDISTYASSFINQIRDCHPDIPILIIENIPNASAPWNHEDAETWGSQTFEMQQTRTIREIFLQLQNKGMEDMHYLSSDGLIGNDTEATIDGIHPNDIGMMRIANQLEPVIRSILAESE